MASPDCNVRGEEPPSFSTISGTSSVGDSFTTLAFRLGCNEYYKKVSIVTGAGSGIGAAVCRELATRGAETVVLVDRSESVYDLADSINSSVGRQVAEVKIGDTTNDTFRTQVYDEVTRGMESSAFVSRPLASRGMRWRWP